MSNKSFFEGWGYTDSMRLLIKGEPKDRNEFIKEFKKTYPKSQIEKSGQKGVELYVNEGELPYVKKLVKIFNLKFAYNDGGKTESQEIARTILSQLGGQGRLIAMTGANNFIALKNGVSFKIKNRKVNYIKITLNGNDLYDVVFGKIISYNLKVLSEHNDIYNDQLIPLFEKQTGMYLKLFREGGNVPQKKLIYVLYGVKDQADSILNASGIRNRGWWRSDLSRTDSDNLLKTLKDRKLIFGAIIYVGDSTNIKFDLGGAIDDEEEDLFANYDKLPIRVQKIIADFSEDDNSYEDCKRFIAKLNKVGYTCEYGLDAEPYGLRKLAPNEKFSEGGTIFNKPKINGILGVEEQFDAKKDIYVETLLIYGYDNNWKNTTPNSLELNKTKKLLNEDLLTLKNSAVNYSLSYYQKLPEIRIKNINGQPATVNKLKKLFNIKIEKLFAEGGMPQGISIADANPYIAGAKVVQGIAPESVSALDKKMADRINPPPPDPNRPVFFVEGGYVAELKPYFDDMIGYNRFGKDNIVDFFLKNQHNFITLSNEIESAERGIEKQYYEHEKMPFHSFVKKYNTVFKQFYHYSSSASDDKIKAEELIENLKKQGYTVVTKTYIFTKGSHTPKNNKAINIFAYKLKF